VSAASTRFRVNGYPRKRTPVASKNALAKAAAANLSAQVLANLGVSLSVQALDAVKLSSRLQHGDFQIAGPLGWTADYPDPQDWLDLFADD